MRVKRLTHQRNRNVLTGGDHPPQGGGGRRPGGERATAGGRQAAGAAAVRGFSVWRFHPSMDQIKPLVHTFTTRTHTCIHTQHGRDGGGGAGGPSTGGARGVLQADAGHGTR